MPLGSASRPRRVVGLAVLLLLLFAAVPASVLAAPPPRGTFKVVVPPATGVNLPQGTVAFFVQHLATHLEKAGVEVVTHEEISAVLGLERQKQLLGCGAADSCMLELGGALGADAVLLATFAKFEDGHHLDLKVVSAKDARRLASLGDQRRGEKALLERLERAAGELALQLGVAPRASDPPARVAPGGRCQSVATCPGWTEERRAPGTDVNALVVQPDGAVWAAGSGGEVWRRQGGAWTRLPPGPPADFYGLALVGERPVVAGVGGALFEWDGRAWKEASPGAANLFAVTPGASGELWALGEQLFVRRQGRWRQLSPLTQGRVLGAWHDGRAGWAVTVDGGILELKGGQWRAQRSWTAEPLNAVWGAAADDVWAVGANGRALHWNGQEWQPRPLPSAVPLTGVHGRRRGEVWAVTRAGGLWQWKDDAWHEVQGPYATALYDVRVAADGTVWVAGADGVIARYAP